jgi:nicotinamide-nucleotide amidase
MRVEIISIGTELLLGEITDTNATTIARALRDAGLDLWYRTTVGDNEDRIARSIEIALARADVVITTGGLGPTVDDMTREAIAKATGHPLVFHEELHEQISARFRNLNIRMSANNKRQAYIPEGAQPIENPVGTAPIFILQITRGVIMVLPGVPHEMTYLLEHALIPWLRSKAENPAIILSRTLRTAGISESLLDEKIADLMSTANPTVGLAAHSGQVDVRITVKAANKSAAIEMITPVEADVRARIGDWIFGMDKETLEETIVRHLMEHNASLAIAEMNTDGMLYSQLRQAALALQVTPVFKIEAIQTLPDTSFLVECAEKEVEQIRARTSTKYAICAIIRVHGDGSQHIAIATTDGTQTKSKGASWAIERSDGGTWVAMHTLALLWRLINQRN